MKISLIVFLMLMGGCSSYNYTAATTALEAGREFIDACMKGDFDKAAFYMVDDSTNNSDLAKIKNDYSLKSSDGRHDYATASIIINGDESIDASTHIISYSNSYDKIARKVKVINRNGIWQVDFKYTFSGNL